MNVTHAGARSTRTLAELQADVESTFVLLDLARAGDGGALERLLARYLTPLRRFAHGRLPSSARDLLDTNDLVQDTLMQTLRRLDRFVPEREGALLAYLRQAIVNRVRDEIRRRARRPAVATLDPESPDRADRAASPLDLAIGHEAAERYEAAMQRLRPEDREAIVARIELDLSFEEIAAALGKPSAEAARKAVGRALLRLAEDMRREG